MKKIILVTGGSKSGKSRYALDLASAYDKKVFIATAEPFDNEMSERIKRHQKERGDNFKTIEEPCDLAGAIMTAHDTTDMIIIDCITLWINNLFYRCQDERSEFGETEDFFEVLQALHCHIIIVTNEVGMGIIPGNRLSRRFAELAGSLNQRIAFASDHVIFMVSGIPTFIKGKKI